MGEQRLLSPEELAALFRRLDALIAEARTLQEQITTRLVTTRRHNQWITAVSLSADAAHARRRIRSKRPWAMPTGSSPKADPVLDFLRLMWAVDHELQSVSKRMLVELGLTGPQRLAVRFIARQPGLAAGELADLLHLDPAR
jgi:hypothetical protein